MTNGSLMNVESIAECSPWSILQYFWPSLSNNLSWKPAFIFFLSGHLRQVLLYRSYYQTHLSSQTEEIQNKEENFYWKRHFITFFLKWGNIFWKWSCWKFFLDIAWLKCKCTSDLNINRMHTLRCCFFSSDATGLQPDRFQSLSNYGK